LQIVEAARCSRRLAGKIALAGIIAGLLIIFLSAALLS
jgi:hypothetical protein